MAETVSLLWFAEWLASTQGSIALHESFFMYPVVESIHVWGLALFLGFTALLDLRLLGVVLRTMPVSQVVSRLRPWMLTGFVIMIVSGFLLFYAIPIRSYQSIFFRAKVVMLILAGLNAFVFHNGIFRRVREWDGTVITPTEARRAGFVSVAMWIFIVFSGRMIAYNWFDCDRQPQPAVINWAAGCRVEVR
jgi:hypothetical protein